MLGSYPPSTSINAIPSRSSGWVAGLFALALGVWLGLGRPLQAAPLPPADTLRAWLHHSNRPDTARVRGYRLLAQQLKNVNLDSARTYAQRGVALARRIGDVRGEAYAQHGLAAIHYLSGNYPAAQRTYEAALAAARRARLCPVVGRAYMGQGLVADGEGNVARALAYFEQARAVFAGCEPPDTEMEIVVLTNIGNTYLQVGKYAESERPLRQAQRLVRPDTSPDPRLNLLDLIGMLQLAQHHPDSAAATWQQELLLARAAHERRAETYALGNLARARLAQGQAEAALAYARQAVALARQTGNQPQLADFTLALAQALRAMGRPEAFDTLLGYTVLRDTLLGRARSEAIARQQVRFDVARQQDRIRVLGQQRRISQLRAERQAARARQWGLVAGALLLLLLSGGVLLGLLLRSRRRLQASEAALRQAHGTQQELMRIIGHDLRGPVALFQQMTPLLREAMPPAASADADELVGELDASAQHLGALVDNLLDWARMQGGLVRCVPVRLRAAAAVLGVTQLYEPVARRKGVTLTTAVDDALLVWADMDLLATVLRNLLGNAIKYTPAGSAVRVAAEGSAAGVVFSVTDAGQGMSAEALAAVLRAERVVSARGTAGEPGTGLGLELCQRFVALLGGELCGEANVCGPGMRFCFVLPARGV